MIVSTVSQGSLNAYFLRRDLFSTLVSFIANEDTKQFAFESTLLLGLLANFRKSEARNPYGVRIEDFVEEGVMTVRTSSLFAVENASSWLFSAAHNRRCRNRLQHFP